MVDEDPKNMSVDIPDDAVQEALESVEKHARNRPEEASGEEDGVEVQIEPERTPFDGEPSREELLATCQELRQKVKDTRDRMLRIAAEADNTRKRALKERKELTKFGQESLLRDILPVIDNLERTLAHVPAQTEDPVVLSLREGLEMTLRQFQDVLAKHHLTGFSAAGEKFDPTLHEALNRVPTEEAEPGTVVSEMQRGYKLHDRLLRPALVSVACRPEELQAQAPAADRDSTPSPDGED